ncbi:MAG TPA: hypothetical protein VFH24_05095 [Gemmatimonadales bacterium]|nr:hypothetical protein [Gemmatimonadales bacterium]
MNPRKMMRRVAIVILTLTVTGCATWQSYGAASDIVAGQALPYRLRAQRADSSRLTLTSPFTRGDTLFGRVHRDTLGIPLTHIVKLQRERMAWDRTVMMVAGVPAAALGLAYLILCSSSCEASY